MKIPTVLQAGFQQDHNLSSWVSSAVARIDTHVNSNRMVFFPEYTDHGIVHLEQTLETAIELATEKARSLLTPEDAAVLVVAVALHDFGMHLTRDGFESLICPGSVWQGTAQLGDKPWSELWTEFFGEATRFDGRKLRALFGEKYRPVRPLPPSGAAWEDFDYLLVGEFLRRHHPRLAHDIALFGLPGKHGNAISVCVRETEDHRFLSDVAGAVARSHGTELRPLIEYLEEVYGNRVDPRRVHAPYLAVLLRIADYFQIQASRAPSSHTDVQTLKSPLSNREWKVHQAVTDIHNTSSDPEAIVVRASPGNVDTFLRLKEWLTGLQDELDRSWAVLGEVYGLQAHNRLNDLALNVRRVKSNLDDVGRFAKTVPYVPARVSFEAANADLLKLLVGPLYGNDPQIGVRELIQNAVDAVRELNDICSREPDLLSVERYDQAADVVVHLELGKESTPLALQVTDRGVGMTTETVQGYFLKAGASLRQSDNWRREHEENGRSRVLRTGRFGVGVLAAFLLGDEVEVTTRHVRSAPDEGLAFSARLDDDMISLNRVTCPAGTRVRVKIADRFQKKIKTMIPLRDRVTFSSGLGHYFLEEPSLVRTVSGRRAPAVPERFLPSLDAGATVEWRCFRHRRIRKGFLDI